MTPMIVQIIDVVVLGGFAVTVLFWLRAAYRVNKEPKCPHGWKVATRVIATPVEEIGAITGHGAAHVAERMLAGTTTVILTCDRCGKIETRTVLGVPEEKGEDDGTAEKVA